MILLITAFSPRTYSDFRVEGPKSPQADVTHEYGLFPVPLKFRTLLVREEDGLALHFVEVGRRTDYSVVTRRLHVLYSHL